MNGKSVRVTIELPAKFVSLLSANCQLRGYTKHLSDGGNPPLLDPAGIVSLLVLMEARGARELEIHAATPMMWRDGDSPEVIHDERRVFEDGVMTSGKAVFS